MSGRRVLQTVLAQLASRGTSPTWPALRTGLACSLTWTRQKSLTSAVSTGQQYRRFANYGTSAFVSPVDLPVIKVTNASVDDAEGMLDTSWDDGSQAQFPLVWLRENCQCKECFHPSSLQRLFLLRNLKLDCSLSELKVSVLDWIA